MAKKEQRIRKMVDQVELRVVLRYIDRTKAPNGRKIRDKVEDVLLTRMRKPTVRVDLCQVTRYPVSRPVWS
jgi:hypothetical protein